MSIVSNETVTADFGSFTSLWRESSTISNQIYLPTYYDTSIPPELKELSKHCELKTIKELAEGKAIEFHTGDEIGKMAYNTGTIPFLRTSDFANWEVNHNPKQGVSEEIYQDYAARQDVKKNDVLVVRDGTYLVGSSLHHLGRGCEEPLLWGPDQVPCAWRLSRPILIPRADETLTS